MSYVPSWKSSAFPFLEYFYEGRTGFFQKHLRTDSHTVIMVFQVSFSWWHDLWMFHKDRTELSGSNLKVLKYPSWGNLKYRYKYPKRKTKKMFSHVTDLHFILQRLQLLLLHLLLSNLLKGPKPTWCPFVVSGMTPLIDVKNVNL